MIPMNPMKSTKPLSQTLTHTPASLHRMLESQSLVCTIDGVERQSRDYFSESMRESIELLGNYVDPREAYIDDDGSQWNQVGMFGASRTGGNNGRRTPLDFNGFSTEYELQTARETVRRMFAYSEHVIAGHNLRVNYTIDTGHVYFVAPRKGKPRDQAKIDALEDFLKEFRKLNKWLHRQRETVLRYDRDGEVFRRRFRKPDGTTVIRFIEPEQVYTPPGMADRPEVDFGIETDPDDAESVVQYFVDEKPVESEDVHHLKANVGLNVRRGVPLVWAGRRNIVRSYKTLGNIAAKNEMAAAVPLNRKHTGTTSAGASTFASAAATTTRRDTTTGQTTNVRKWGPGTILDTSANVEYEALNLAEGIEEMVAGNKEVLRALATVFGLAEFMLTSDASNANYSSTMVSEGPVVRTISALQAIIRDDDLQIITEAVEWAIERGVLDADTLEVCEIQCRLPGLATKEVGEEAAANRTKMEAGILSPQSWSAEEGLDYEQEQANIEAHRAAGRKMAGDLPPGLGGGLGPDGKPIDPAKVGPDGKPIPPASRGAGGGSRGGSGEDVELADDDGTDEGTDDSEGTNPNAAARRAAIAGRLKECKTPEEWELVRGELLEVLEGG